MARNLDIAGMLEGITKAQTDTYRAGFAAGYTAAKREMASTREPEEFEREAPANTEDREDREEIR